jgi:hypothetical protein
MRNVTLSMTEDSITTGVGLVDRYGAAASFSAVVRRALALLDDEWTRINGSPRASELERARMAAFLGEAKRGRGPAAQR